MADEPKESLPDAGDVVEDKDARMWGMLCHLSALAGYIIPLGNILGPLVVWLIKKDDIPFVADQGKEALNFQISVSIYMAVCLILVLVFIGIILGIIVGVGALLLLIIAAIKANSGEYYRYPLTIRLIK